MTTTALAVIDPKKIQRLDEVANNYQLADSSKSPFGTSFTLAASIGQLRELLTEDVMRPIMNLSNSPLGFLTDRDPSKIDKDTGKPVEPYSIAVVRDVVIEATLRGFYPAGNEFNIIAGRFYAAKAGIRRKVTTWRGLTDFKDFYEVPRIMSGGDGAIVKAKATWKLGGVEDSLEREFGIRVNKGMGADAITGKAERKLLKAVLDRISGIITPDGDIDEGATGAHDEAARAAAAKPVFAKVESTVTNPAPAPEASKPADPAPVNVPTTASAPASESGPFTDTTTSNAPDAHQELRDWLEAQGIQNQEIMRYARENNVCGQHVMSPSKLKPEEARQLLESKDKVYKALEGYRAAKKP